MTLPDEQESKARRLAMLKAMEMSKSGQNQFCSKCADNQERHNNDSRKFCEEIQHLRSAAQKMVDQLAAYMSRPSLRAFAEALELDRRLFTIPGDFDTYRPVPFPVEAAISRKELDQVVAERDIAKMKLSVVAAEVRELKAAQEEATKASPQVPAEAQERLAVVERRIEAFADHLGCSAAGSRNDAKVSDMKAKISAFDQDCKGNRGTSASQRLSRKIDIGNCNSAARDHKSMQRPSTEQFQLQLQNAETAMQDLEGQCKRRNDTPVDDLKPTTTPSSQSSRRESSKSSLTKALSAGNLRRLDSPTWKGEAALPKKYLEFPASPQPKVAKGRSSRLILFSNDALPGLQRAT